METRLTMLSPRQEYLRATGFERSQQEDHFIAAEHHQDLAREAFLASDEELENFHREKMKEHLKDAQELDG